jgi:hypothetical protein
MFGTPKRDPIEDRLWLYKEVLRIERHWTEQLQNQQARISTVLTVNGFLLAFLGIAAFTQSRSSWPYESFYISVAILALALVPGILALLPQIPIAGATDDSGTTGVRKFLGQFGFKAPEAFPPAELWLDANRVRDRFTAETELTVGLLDELCIAAAGNAKGNLDHSRTNRWRRMFLHWELALMLLAVIPLLAAIAGLFAHAV